MECTNQPCTKKLGFSSGQFCQTYASAQDQCACSCFQYHIENFYMESLSTRSFVQPFNGSPYRIIALLPCKCNIEDLLNGIVEIFQMESWRSLRYGFLLKWKLEIENLYPQIKDTHPISWHYTQSPIPIE